MTVQLGELTTDEQITRGRRWDRVLRPLEAVEMTLGALLIFLVLVLVMWQVLGRITPLTSPVWTGEIAKFCLIWLAFSLAGYLMGREEHITLDVIDHVLPATGRRIVHTFSLLVVAVTALALAYEGYDIFASNSPIKSPAAGVPLGLIYLLPTLGMVLTAVRALLLAFVPGTRPEHPAPDASEQPTPYRHPEQTEEPVS